MIALVMAGGKGSRMDSKEEKLLLQYQKPVVLHVIDALRKSGCFSRIVAATSGNSPKTRAVLLEYGTEIIDTSGADYVPDLNFALSQLDDTVMVVSGDLPLLDADVVQKMISQHKKESTWQSFVVTKDFLASQGIAAEFSVMCGGLECYYTGISLVNPKMITPQVNETCTVFDDKRIAMNLNTKYDYSLLKNA